MSEPREYAALKTLRAGEVLDMEGLLLKIAEGPIQVGDLYVAERNSGPKLLTAKEIVRREEFPDQISFIIPTTCDYPFDGWECVKICEA